MIRLIVLFSYAAMIVVCMFVLHDTYLCIDLADRAVRSQLLRRAHHIGHYAFVFWAATPLQLFADPEHDFCDDCGRFFDDVYFVVASALDRAWRPKRVLMRVFVYA